MTEHSSLQRLVITRGLPGSGKTSWALGQPDLVRVNRDDIRSAYGLADRTHTSEKTVTTIETFVAETLLFQGHSVVIDDTNLRLKHAVKWRDVAERHRVRFQVEDFLNRVDVDTCVRRDAERDRQQRVGEDVIRSLHARFARSWSVEDLLNASSRQNDMVTPVIQDPSLPRAIIVDLDGTLADKGDRDPYDASTCERDTIIEPVATVVRRMLDYGHRVLFFTGRQECDRQPTERWLARHGFLGQGLPTSLHMRATGDMRADEVVKREMFAAHCERQVYVEFVLDDRNRVVSMWRALGLTCLQAAEGCF